MDSSRLQELLRAFIETKPQPKSKTKAEEEDEIEAEMEALKLEDARKEAAKDPSLKAIPRFFTKKPLPPAVQDPSPPDTLQSQLKRIARMRFLQNKSTLIADADDLELLGRLLIENATPPLESGDERINFDAFEKIRQRFESKYTEYFRASTFLRFPKDELGRVKVSVVFNYVCKKASFVQNRLALSLPDSSGAGYLRENEVESYVMEQLQILPCLRELQPTFHPYYTCTAVRKFFFYLDPQRRGRIKIKDMLLHPVFSEFRELDNDSFEDVPSNWFSTHSAMRVYAIYLRLDEDHNGMLSRMELRNFCPERYKLTETFIDRVFEVCHTYEGEMDYKTYLDFVLAMEHKKTPEALQYFWRIFDVQERGYIGAAEINYFFRDILQGYAAEGLEPVNPDDVKDEIFDMVKPVDPLKITLQDLIASKQGDIVVNILSDVQGFWNYDNRESLANQEPDNGEQSY